MTNHSSETPRSFNSSNVAELDSCSIQINHTSQVLLYTFLTLVIICTVVGNTLVILSILYFKTLQSPTNSFVLSLAVADCLVGLVVMPFSMARTIQQCWIFGHLFCKIHSSLDVMLCTASILHLSCIAFDRYCAVCNPLSYSLKMSNARVVVLIMACWIIPLLISFGPVMLELHVIGMQVQIAKYSCVFMVNQVYAVLASVVSFYLPMVTMLLAYWKIYKVAKRQARQISAMESQIGKITSKRQKHQNAMKREGKAAKILGIVMGVFLFFWMPFFTVNVVDPFIGYRTEAVVGEVFLWLGYLNSSLNPFLYVFLNRSFRKAFLMFVRCKVCLHQPTSWIELSQTGKDVRIEQRKEKCVNESVS